MTAPTRSNRPRLSTLALALEPRMMFDAAAVATGAETAAQAEAQQTGNQAPTLSADASHATYTVGQSDATGVEVFKNTSASTVDSGQAFDTLVITVDSSNSQEALVIDGKTIQLTSELSGVTENNAYSYQVSTSGGQTTVSLFLSSSDANSAADLKTLVDGIRYKALDTSIDSGARTITLSSLKDDGGTADGGTDTTALNLSSSISLVNDTNRPPVLVDAGVPDLAQAHNIKDLGTSKEVVYSADGKHLYAAGANGTLVTFAVDEHGNLTTEQVLKNVTDLGTLNDLTLSADGKSLYALSGSKIITLNVAGDGQLSYAASTSAGGNLISLALSEDGKQLYVTNQYDGLAVFERNTETGALGTTAVQRLNEGALGGGRSRTVLSVGDYVYVVSGTSVVTLERGSDGKLTKLLDGTLSVGISSTTPTTLTASADGRFVYLSDASNGVIKVLELRDSSDGKELILVDSTLLGGVSSLALSSDGQRLFATSSSGGTLSVYRVGSDGRLTLTGTLSDVPGAVTVSTSPDGQSVVVGGTGLNRFSDVQTYISGSDSTVASGVTLSDVNLDKLNAGQGNYQGASVTLERTGGASSDDSFGFKTGSGLSLSGDKVLKNGVEIGTFNQSGGTLTITFSTQLTSAEANAVLHQVTYHNSTSPDGTLISLNLVANDGELNSQALVLTLLLSNNSAPTLTTTVVSHTPYDTATVQTPLFSDTAVNTGEVGQTVLSLDLKVSGLVNPADEFLIIDGTRIDLSQSGSGTTASGYSYSYVRDGSTATLHISRDSGISSTAVQNLVNGIAYVNDSASAVSGSRTFTLATLRDDGGTANGSSDSRDLNISTTLAIAVNNAPQAQVDVSVDTNLYYFNGSLSGYTDYVSGVTLSSDGKTLLVIGNSGSNTSGISYLRVYSRDPLTGALSLTQSFTQGSVDNPDTVAIEVNGLNTISTVTVSADGSLVYVAGYSTANSVTSASLLLFKRDANGTLTFDSVVASGTSGLNAPISEIVLSADGQSLYTINGVNPHDVSTGKSEVAMFSRDPNSGALSFIGSYVGGSAALGLNVPTGIVVSGDGRSVYISNASSAMITVLSRDPASGVLTYVGAITQASIAASADAANQPTDLRYLQNLQDIVISPDNNFVYVSSGSYAFVSIFQRQADGSLSYVGSVDTYNTQYSNSLALREMALSADGKTLYVSTYGGQSLLVFSRDLSTGKLTFVENLKGNKNYNHLVVSSDGLNLYTGTSSFISGLDIFSAKANGDYSEQQPTVFAEHLDFSDIDLDALDNYQGASITVVRNGGANSDDLFGFSTGNGLSLEGGQVFLDNQPIAEVSNSGGTLKVTFSAEVTQEQVNQVLHQLTYANGADSQPARVDLQISFSDGSKSVSSGLTLLLNQAPDIGNPGYSLPAATGNSPYTVTLPSDLFSDAEGDSLTWDLSGLPAGLSFDAATLTLSGTPSGLGVGEHALTLRVVDNLGNATERTITLQVAADPSQVPSLGGDSSSLEYAGNTDGNVPGSDGSVLAGAKDTVVSGDGKYLYVVSISPDGPSSVSVFSRAADGSLTWVQSLSDSAIAGLAGALKVVVSADQQSLYVIGSDANSLLVFSRDSDSGQLTLRSTLAGPADSSITAVASHGDQVYVASGDSVRVYQQQSDGQLTLLRTYQDGVGGLDGLQGVQHLLVSADGRFLFIGASGDNSIDTAMAINSDGSLTLINTLVGSSADSAFFIQALSVSADGKTLYALNNDTQQTLEILAIGADGRLSLVSSLALDGSVTDIQVAADGSAVFVIGSEIQVFKRDSGGQLTLQGSFDRWDNPWGIGFADLTSASLSPDGKQLYISGSVDWNETLLVLNIGLPEVTYTEGDAAIALLPSGTLSDPQLDAAGDYNGASLTIGRDGGSNAADTYGFIDDNGLTLSNGQIFKNGVAIADFVDNNGVLTVTFMAATSPADARNVLRQIAYRNGSQDPTAQGAGPTFAILLNDGDNNSASVRVKVNLVGVNDPAILDSTVLDPTLAEDNEFVSLFKDTQIDTVEAEQKIWHVVLTLDAANAHDLLRVGGDKIVLDSATSGTAQTASGLSYSVSISGGVTTVTLYLMRSAEQTAALIDGIGYNNSGSGLSGTRTIGLSINEYTDGQSGETRTTLAESVKVTLTGPSEPNSPPVLGGGATVDYTERSEPVLIAPGVVVQDAQMDRFNNGLGNYNGATLTITLGSGSTHLDHLGFNAGNGLTLNGTALQKDGVTIGQLSNADGVLSIRFNDDAGTIPTTADVQNVLRQITYANDSHTPVASVAISVILADRSLASSTLDLTIAITAINDLPVLTQDPLLSQGDLAILQNLTQVPGLGALTQVSLSTDGRSVYVSDGSGAIAQLSRDPLTGQLSYVKTLAATGLESIQQLLVSQDGSQVYAVSGSGENVIVVLQRDPATGALSVGQSLVNEDSNNYSLFNPISLQESADGKHLYLLTDNGITVLNRSNGQLSYLENLGNDAWSAPYQHQPVALVVAGDYVFVVTDPASSNFANTLIAYKRGADGSLSVAGYVRDTQTDSGGKTVSMADPKHLAASADGQLIYVAGTNSVQVLRFNAADGSFTDLGILASGLGNVSDMALSADGQLLYVSSSDGSLQRYSTANQQLTLVDTLRGSDAAALVNAGQISLSNDGGVVVLGSGLAVLQAEAMDPVQYELGAEPVPFAGHLTLSDAELDAANNGAGDYQGASISVSRSPVPSSDDHFGFVDGNGIRLVDGQLLRGNEVIGTFVDNGGQLTLTFSASVSTLEARTILRQLTYANSAEDGPSARLSLSVVLNDGQADSPAQAVDLDVRGIEPNLPPVVSPGSYVPPSAVVGQPYQVVLPANLFSDPNGDPLTLSLDNLPDGLSFDPATRTLSGTLDSVGRLTLTLVATDPSGDSVSRELTLNVKAVAVTGGAVDSTTPVVQRDGPGWSAPAPVAGRDQPMGGFAPPPVWSSPLSSGSASASANWLGLGSLNGLPDDQDLSGLNRGLSSLEDYSGRLVRLSDDSSSGLSATRTSLGALLSVEQGSLLTRFQLPDGLFSHAGGPLEISLHQANGQPLPGWIRFDGRSGLIQVESRQLAELQRLQLRLVARDAAGHRVEIPVRLQVSEDGAATLQASPAEAPASESQATSQAALDSHLQASGQSGVLARGQALLQALFGTAPGDDKNAA